MRLQLPVDHLQLGNVELTEMFPHLNICVLTCDYMCVRARDFILKMFLKVVFVWNIPEWGGAGGLLLVLGNAGRAAEGQLPEER
jgi:hypothetical protein